MIARLSGICGSLAPALADHLWQSTLFAIAAGLLTVSLRRNEARARYCLWFAASLKFLIPLSLLVSLSSYVGRIENSASTGADLCLTAPAGSDDHGLTSSRGFDGSFSVLAGVWLAGCVLVLSTWYMRWRNVSRYIRNAVPLRN